MYDLGNSEELWVQASALWRILLADDAFDMGIVTFCTLWSVDVAPLSTIFLIRLTSDSPISLILEVKSVDPQFLYVTLVSLPVRIFLQYRKIENQSDLNLLSAKIFRYLAEWFLNIRTRLSFIWFPSSLRLVRTLIEHHETAGQLFQRSTYVLISRLQIMVCIRRTLDGTNFDLYNTFDPRNPHARFVFIKFCHNLLMR